MSTNYNTNLFLSLYGRNKSEGCVVITGMTGVDKTTMCRMVLRKKECENLPEFALNRLIYDQNLFGAILQNFGILGLSTRKHTKRIKIYQLIQYLLKTLKEEEFALLVVDDDQNLILSKSEQEKVTSSLEENKKKHLQIMLTGQVPGGQDLKSSRLEQFYNNEKCMYQTPRGLLRLEAIQNYIERRLMVADPEGDMRFSKEALEYVRKHSLGIPSIRNLIYDGDFTDTYTRQIIETKEEFVENIVHHIALKGQEIATTELKPVSMTKIKQNILIPTATLFLTSMTKIRQNVLTPTATLFLTSMTKIRQNVLTPTTTLFLTSMTKIRQSILIPTTTLFLTLMTKIRQNVFTPTATLFLTSMTKIRQSVLTPTTTLFLTSMTKIRQNILTPTATLFLTSMTKIKQNILTLTATLFLTSMTKIRQNILTPTATLFLTSINKIRQNILIPTATLFLTSINKIRQNILIPTATLFLTSINKIRQKALIPAAAMFLASINKIRQKKALIPAAAMFLASINKIRQKKALIPAAAVFLVCVVVAGFFTSHSFFTKNDPIHSAAKGLPDLHGKSADSTRELEKREQPEDAIIYSLNTMVRENSGYVPEQELQELQWQIAEKPTVDVKKKLFRRALMYQNNGELLKAGGQYLELLKLYPNDIEIHNNLGSVYQELGNYNNAVIEYRKAIYLNPNYYTARNNLGVVLYKNGDFRAAMKEFKIILGDNPKDVQCITNLGALSKKMRHPEMARRFFEEALAIDPAYPEAHYNMAILLEKDEVNRAIFHFQKFLDYATSSQHLSRAEEVIKRLESLFGRNDHENNTLSDGASNLSLTKFP